MRRKKPTISQIYNQRFWQTRDWARTLKDSHPEIRSIKIGLTFKAVDSFAGTPAPRTIEVTADQKAFFQMQCPFKNCVGGGFDFSQAIRGAIKTKLPEIEGRDVCKGSPSEYRMGTSHCLLAAHYTIAIEYEQPPASSEGTGVQSTHPISPQV